MSKILAICLSLSLLASASASQQTDSQPPFHIDDLAEIGRAIKRALRPNGRDEFRSAIQKERSFYQEVLSPIKPSSIRPSELYKWALAYGEASMPKRAEELCDLYLSTNPHSVLVFKTHMLSAKQSVALKDNSQAIQKMKAAPVGRLRDAAEFSTVLAEEFPKDQFTPEQLHNLYDYASQLLNKFIKQPFYEGDQAAYKDALSHLPEPELEESLDRVLTEAANARTWLTVAQSAVFVKEHRIEDAKSILRKAIAETQHLPDDQNRRLTMELRKFDLDSTVINSIPQKQVIGQIKDPKDQIVILHVFAHYTRNSFKALQDLSKLSQTRPDVQVVGVTSLWGYWKDRDAKVSGDVESKALQDALSEANINFPVIISSLQNYELTTGYGGLPQTIIFKRSGAMHKAIIGGGPDLVSQVEQEISQLAAPLPKAAASKE